jgi:hypothetical protein
LVLDQVPQECTGGPGSRLGSYPSSMRMALVAAYKFNNVQDLLGLKIDGLDLLVILVANYKCWKFSKREGRRLIFRLAKVAKSWSDQRKWSMVRRRPNSAECFRT